MNRIKIFRTAVFITPVVAVGLLVFYVISYSGMNSPNDNSVNKIDQDKYSENNTPCSEKNKNKPIKLTLKSKKSCDLNPSEMDKTKPVSKENGIDKNLSVSRKRHLSSSTVIPVYLSESIYSLTPQEQKKVNDEANDFVLADVLNDSDVDSEPGDGVHRTGGIEPTEEKKEKQVEQKLIFKGIRLNKIGLARINAERTQKELPELIAGKDVQVAPIGKDLITVPNDTHEQSLNKTKTETLAADIVEVADASPGKTSSPPIAYSDPELPASVDNSTLQYFPPIRSQGTVNSCAQWAGIYYTMTHETALVRGWNAKTGGDFYRFSPSFVYNMVLTGEDGGSNPSNGWIFAKKQGMARMSEFHVENDYKTWCTDPAVYRRALTDRIEDYSSISGMNTQTGLDNLKAYLNNGHVAVCRAYIGGWLYKTVSDDPGTPDDDAFTGEDIVYKYNGSVGYDHYMTVVGYNDNIWVDSDNDSIVDANEKGALLIANSWGTSWGNDGFVWVGYDTILNENAFKGNIVDFITPFNELYVPKVIAKITINHNRRDQIYISPLGIGPTSSTTPDFPWVSTVLLTFMGTENAFDGSAPTYQDFTYYIDYEELLPSVGTETRWFLEFYDNSSDGNSLTVKGFDLYQVSGETDILVSSASGLPVVLDGSAQMIWADWTYEAPPNSPPVADDQSRTVFYNTPTVVTMTASDANGDDLTYSIVSGPTNGTLSVVSGQDVTYTPNPDYSGPDSFTFKANDTTEDSNTATVTITVSLPEVSVSATDASAYEQDIDQGIWTITRNGDTTDPLTVNFTLSGGATYTDDYTSTETTSVTIPSGQNSVDVTLTPVDDSTLDEGDETATLTITVDSAYIIGTPSSADITIVDNDTSHALTVINGSGDGSYLPGTGVSIFADPPPTGYSFSNWTASPDSGSFADPNAASTIYTMPNSAVEVTANYQPSDYTVTFDKQGGTGGSDSVLATYDSAMPTATAPARVGYSFEGYFIDSECTGTQYYNADISSAHIWDITSDTTLYAKWATGPLVVPIVDVFVHNEKENYGGTPGDVINGSGMNGYGIDGNPGWPSGEGLPDTWTATSNVYQAEHQTGDLLAADSGDLDPAGNPLGTGVGPSNGKIGWFVFDLGASTSDLKNLYIWNIRENSGRIAASFNVYVSESPTVAVAQGPTNSTSRDYDFASGGWTEVANGLTGTYRGDQVVDLGGATARYIGIEIMTNGGDASRTGLAEVGITKENTPPATYTLTVNNGTGGGDYEEGSEVAISATVPEGQHFVNWTGDTANLADANSASTTVTMPASAVTVTANFAINEYTLTYTAGAGGTITGSTSQTVNHGSDGTSVTAVPDNGYVFVNWSDASTDNPRTDTGVTGDITVTANFAHDGTSHSADSNSDWSISQDEVESFITSYNNNNNTVTTANGDITSGRITMREVMRVIYLYNNGGAYIGGQATVDTYDIVAPSAPATDTATTVIPETEGDGTLVVSSTADSGAGSLRDAIAMAGYGETIIIDGSIDTITLLSEIVIDKSITIDGQGVAIVSGGNQTRIFRIENDTEAIDVTIKNIGIVDAENSSDEFGGAIYNNGQTLTLDTVLLDGNANSAAHQDGVQYGKGGAVYSSGTLNVENCVFTNNTASEEDDVFEE